MPRSPSYKIDVRGNRKIDVRAAKQFDRVRKIEQIVDEAEDDPDVPPGDAARIERIGHKAKGRKVPINEIPKGFGDRKWAAAEKIDDYIQQIVDVAVVDDPITLLEALRESDQNYAVKDWSIMGRGGPDFWLGQVPIRWNPSCMFLKKIGYAEINVKGPGKEQPQRRILMLTQAGKDGKYDQYLDLR